MTLADSIAVRDFDLAHVDADFANFCDLIGRDLGSVPHPGAVSLGNAIRDVVFLGSEEQVIWIDARRIVAGMTDTFSVENRSIDQDPHESVRSNRPVGVARFPVAISIGRSIPDPASVRGGSFLFQSFNRIGQSHAMGISDPRPASQEKRSFS